jgi:hypothetical protein
MIGHPAKCPSNAFSGLKALYSPAFKPEKALEGHFAG